VLALRLFGRVEVKVTDETAAAAPPKELALLAYLALQSGPVPRSAVHALLWPESGSGGLRVALSRLRDLPASETWLQTEGSLLSVRADTDVARFEAALSEGDARAALAAWPDDRGELLAGLEVRHAEPFEEWLAGERMRLGNLRADARRALLAELERTGAPAEALAVARGLVADDPLDEAAHRAVMRLEHARGNTETALAQFERLRVLLRDELGVEPMAETLAELAGIEGAPAAAGERAQALRRGDAVPGRATRLLGRAAQLRAVEKALRETGRVLVHGAGGIGKTTLAAEVTARGLGRGERAVWVRSAGADPSAVFDALAAALDARAQVARAVSAPVAVGRLLTDEQIDLVVVDDAANAYTVARVAETLPADCRLLVTSRQRYPSLERVWLDRLERPEARELLEVHAGRAIQAPAADAVCALLGDHPFAVRIAGVALGAGAESVEHLVARIAEAPHTLALPTDLADPGRESVAALLEVSLEDLPDDVHEALMAVGALSLPSVTPELLAELTRRSVDAAEDALDALQARALAERLSEPGSDVVRYRVHDLTHSLARANTHVRRSAARRACLRFLERRFGEHALVEEELAEVVTAVRETLDAGEAGEAVTAMVRLCGPNGFFTGRGHTPGSLALLERTAEAAEGLDVPAARTLYGKLGNARRELLGDLGGARESYGREAELARAQGDSSREAIARSLYGSVRVEMGDREGEADVVAAVALARRSGDDLALAQALQALSFVAGERGRHAEAAELSAEAVAVADRMGPDVEPQEIDQRRFFARFNLGVARCRSGDVAGGRDALEEALSVARQRGNPGWEAYALHELAELEDGAGRTEAAIMHARAALELYDRHRMRPDGEALRAWLSERGVRA